MKLIDKEIVYTSLYQKAYKEWKKVFDSAMKKYGNISNN